VLMTGGGCGACCLSGGGFPSSSECATPPRDEERRERDRNKKILPEELSSNRTDFLYDLGSGLYGIDCQPWLLLVGASDEQSEDLSG
jgi:hypothetical protein